MIERAQELISTDHQMTLRMMEEELEVSRETTREVFVEDLGKQKICSKFVPHCLTNEQKVLRLQACQEFIQFVNDDCSLLGSLVMGDETWCHQYDSQTKIQSMEWRSPSSKHFDFKSQKPK
jgi:hypothetical protein